MLDCSHPEDNTRKILQVLSSLQSRAEEIYFCTNDIYVVVLLSAYMPIFSKLTLLHRLQPNVELVWFETLLLVNQYNRWLCQVRKYTELLFLHSLSRCDYTSSFFHLGKAKFWHTCLVNASILNTFLKCCDCLNLPLSKDDMNVIKNLSFSCTMSIQLITIASILLNMNCLNIVAVWKYVLYHQTQDILAHHINNGYLWKGHINQT